MAKGIVRRLVDKNTIWRRMAHCPKGQEGEQTMKNVSHFFTSFLTIGKNPGLKDLGRLLDACKLDIRETCATLPGQPHAQLLGNAIWRHEGDEGSGAGICLEEECKSRLMTADGGGHLSHPGLFFGLHGYEFLERTKEAELDCGPQERCRARMWGISLQNNSWEWIVVEITFQRNLSVKNEEVSRSVVFLDIEEVEADKLADAVQLPAVEIIQKLITAVHDMAVEARRAAADLTGLASTLWFGNNIMESFLDAITMADNR